MHACSIGMFRHTQTLRAIEYYKKGATKKMNEYPWHRKVVKPAQLKPRAAPTFVLDDPNRKTYAFDLMSSRTFDTTIADGANIFANIQAEKPDNVSSQKDFRQTQAPHWSQRQRPTHFIAFRVPKTSSLLSNVASYHRDVADTVSTASLTPLLTPLSRLHLTAAVFTLKDPEREVPMVRDVMDAVLKKQGPMSLEFRGLSTFSNGRVVFINPTTEKEFQQLILRIRQIRWGLYNLGIDIKGNPYDDFTPHVTLAKMTPRLRNEFIARDGVRLDTVPLRLWNPVRNDDFGSSMFSNIVLCQMKGQNEAGDFWCTAHEIELTGKRKIVL